MIDKLSKDCPCRPKPSRKRARRPGAPDEDDDQAFLSAAALSSLNTRAGTPTLSNCWRRSTNSNRSWSRSRYRTGPTWSNDSCVSFSTRSAALSASSTELLLATKTEALADLIARVESRILRILWSLRVADAAPEVETTPPPSEVSAEPPTTGRPIVVDHVVQRRTACIVYVRRFTPRSNAQTYPRPRCPRIGSRQQSCPSHLSFRRATPRGQ